ncbi:MAG: DUF4261 domain-containing protein [Longicatena sp.]
MQIYNHTKKTIKKALINENLENLVLLASAYWNKQKFLEDFHTDWNMGEQVGIESIDDKDSLVLEVDGIELEIILFYNPIPKVLIMRGAKINYMWEDAVEVAKQHRAYLNFTIRTETKSKIACETLLTKAIFTCLKQKEALGVFVNEVLLQRVYYCDMAALLKDAKNPIMNWIWFGINQYDSYIGYYTYGMKKFDMNEMEIYIKTSNSNLNSVRVLLISIVSYVLSKNINLHSGEIIKLKGKGNLNVTLSEGKAIEGMSLKIDCGDYI